MDTTIKVHEHLEYEIIEQKKTSTIVKNLNKSYRCFKIDSPIGDKITLFTSKIKEDGSFKFEYSILNSYYNVGEEYEFDIKEVQDEGIILKDDKAKTHFCPFDWAIKPEQKKIKLRVRELDIERNRLKFESPNQNEESSMKDFLDDFMGKINILRETGSNSYNFPIIDESIVNKHPILDIINKKYEILNLLNNTSQESILELFRLLIINDEHYELIKLVITYNLLDTIQLEENYSHKILELIYENLKDFYLKKIPQNTDSKQMDKIIAYLHFLENGNYYIYQESHHKNDVIIHESEKIDGYLLQCYDNGCINKVKIRDILYNKKNNKMYKNGKSLNANLLKMFVLREECLIYIKTEKNNENFIKLHKSESITNHTALRLQGNKVIQVDFDKLLDYRIINIKYENSLKRIIRQHLNIGVSINSQAHDNEFKILHEIMS